MNKKINHKTTKDLIGLPGPTDDHLGRMREVEIDLGIRKMFVGNAKIYSMWNQTIYFPFYRTKGSRENSIAKEGWGGGGKEYEN